MKLDAETLLALLPAFYRERDAELDGPLRALLGVIARQGALVEGYCQEGCRRCPR